MSMRWDPLLAAATARELHDRLEGARVSALLMDAESRRVILYLRDSTVVFELHPLRGWLSLLPAADPPSVARRLPARVLRVEALRDESALRLALPRVRGREEGMELVVEMVGNRWNAVAVGHRSRVIRHVLLTRDRPKRALTVGATYEPPGGTGRSGLDGNVSHEAWARVVAEAGPESDDRRVAILRAVAWTSSLNVDALLGTDGWERWRSMIEPESWRGFLLETDRGAQPYPISRGDRAVEAFPTLLDAFGEGRRRDEESAPAKTLLLPPSFMARLEKRLDRARGKARGLTRELESARDPGPIRAVGDLILARFADIPRGAESVTLTSFEGEPVEVELDPALAPNENAARYYDEAGRMERAREALPARIEAADAEVERWESLRARAGSGDVSVSDLESALGPARPARDRTSGSGPPSQKLPYRRFLSSGGLEIRVGRGARANDDLTFHHSSPDDIWLHARQAPGAHVVLRWSGNGSPPRRDLAEAASLAALHSDARHSGSVPVGWTRRKYVRKPRKAPPGSVTPDRMETVFVTPKRELLRRLAIDDA